MSFCSGGGSASRWGQHPGRLGGVCIWGGSAFRGVEQTPHRILRGTVNGRAGSTHPTGMHSCFWGGGLQNLVTGRNEVLAKVIFSQACVILSTGGGGCLLQISGGGPGQVPPRQAPPPGTHPPWQAPPPGRHPPGRHPPWQAPPPGRHPPRQAPPPPPDTVKARPVRILLECILVKI